MPLVAQQVRNAKPQAKKYKLADGGGLYLLVESNGAKYWRLKYRFGGKEKVLALGVYCSPPGIDASGKLQAESVMMTLAEARGQREEAKATLAKGIDPGLLKKEKKRDALLAGENSLAAVAREWHSRNSSRWSPQHKERVMRELEADILPFIGAVPVENLKARDLLAVLRKVEARGVLDLAGRLRQRLVGIMRYAVQTGRIDSNPALDLDGALAVYVEKHRPSLMLERLPELVMRIDDYRGRILTKSALKFCLLTFVRSSEMRMMRWAEVDMVRGIWIIPPQRELIEDVPDSHRGAKMKTPHIVPLSRQTLAVLEDLQAITGRFELVFAGDHNVAKPMSENTVNKALRTMGYDTKTEIYGHGFRTMACSALNESGLWNRDAIERQMSHQERNNVRAAYIHKAEFLVERRAMMQWWADFLDAQRGGCYVDPSEFAGSLR
ncbi:DUF4102 domain-containing protein [Aquitalea sp. S1-19]|nr:DUF4102 domain-containing protein [Aquitalea sp. S1-19]